MDGIGLLGLGAGLGAGLAIVGGGAGIGKLAAAAVEGIARQPESAGDIKGAMIITAAFIEGATLFAVVVCLLLSTKIAAPGA
ncbi:MAG TPA: ATP synthase F0 subunit C [Planctomycetota bacterium]|nr:ATP synthase F0 subunit C [Planctomycetota bacterium]